jgi:hypothetical protein
MLQEILTSSTVSWVLLLLFCTNLNMHTTNLLFVLVKRHPFYENTFVPLWNNGGTNVWILSDNFQLSFFLVFSKAVIHMHCSVPLDIVKLARYKHTTTSNTTYDWNNRISCDKACQVTPQPYPCKVYLPRIEIQSSHILVLPHCSNMRFIRYKNVHRKSTECTKFSKLTE